MNVAELPVPQSSCEAMCPPQAMTTVERFAVVVKLINPVEKHFPVPCRTFWFTYEKAVRLVPSGPKIFMDPEPTVPTKVPAEPPQFVSVGASIDSVSSGAEGSQSLAANTSPHGLLLFAWNALGVDDVVSVASKEPM